MDARMFAGREFSGYQCEVCDFELQTTDPCYVDADGGYGDDGSQERVRVRHTHCHEFVERMVADVMEGSC
jgi:hypothetical protein